MGRHRDVMSDVRVRGRGAPAVLVDSAPNMAGMFDEVWSVDGNGFVGRWSKYQNLNILLVRDAH